jgi:hypothetical protein
MMHSKNVLSISIMFSLALVEVYSQTYVDNVDILIAGGSLSAVAAAITAANLTSNMSIVLLEPTDWPGG